MRGLSDRRCRGFATEGKQAVARNVSER